MKYTEAAGVECARSIPIIPTEKKILITGNFPKSVLQLCGPLNVLKHESGISSESK